MTIRYAMLGLLSWKPLSGYDLKKLFVELSAFYWSGNNNQIYKTLVQLLEDGLVSSEIHHQEHSPNKKIYTITEQGVDELRSWVLSIPEPPEFRSTFLIQLAWADLLQPEELVTLVDKYEHEVEMLLVMEKEKARRSGSSPQRTPRELYLWEMITDNIISAYENELNWVRRLKRGLAQKSSHFEGGIAMHCRKIEQNGIKYVEGLVGHLLIQNEYDALDLMAYCGENDTDRLLLQGDNFTPQFFDLKSGIAGAVLQKFTNYRMKVAAVISPQLVKGRFKQMASESNQGSSFRIFNDYQTAVDWVTS
ncbi:MAG: DUF4180 domain-containing protein [Ignavibacteriales bacterium]